MTPERWQKIEEIFQDALDMPWSEREKFVAEKCGDDADLKSEVEKLLSQFEDASSFIETPAISDEKAGVLSKLIDLDDDDPMLGTLLGSYRIEREIGRGGMGAVYEAIRADGEFRRKTAIKIVKRGMDTDFILRRFRNERQILATLEHPYITRLLDGGTTDDGRPYFVMDYIEGLALYRYCDKNRLTIEERLKLFIRICEAVEYAHQNLVIHRDLKPSNILVSADGTPRLLDFGIAKLLNPEMASDTLQPTATAMRMMTLDYASPEQINGEKVTFSTDVYSLGVILFELLTGHRPYRFPNRTPHEIARVICEEQPILPSDAITRSEETLPIIHVDQEALTIRHLADLRKNSPDKLREILRGNIDNITLKALCKSPDDRYNSVKRFREDIEKHLEGKPVSAPLYAPIDKVSPAQDVVKTKLIAVLPLKLLNFSATENTDENYLSIGLADAIISRLTNVRDFTVRPTSSISGYEKSDVDPLQAGKELGVDFVLDGRIKKYGETLRISLQMLDVNKGSTTWAGQFDEKFSDVLTLEDAISEQVAEALVSQVTGENLIKLGKRGTDNAEAYEAYLKGRFYWNQFTPDSLPKAIEQFQKAVSLDPNFALAHVGVADFYIWANIYGLIPSLESYKQAESAVQRALEIDNRLGEAFATLGLIKQNQFKWQESENIYPQAIDLCPNYPNVYEWYSAVLIGSGKVEKGLKMLARSEELDPLSLRTKTLVAWTKYNSGEFTEALAKANEIINLDSNYPQGHLQKGYVLCEIGDGNEAVTEIEKGMSLMPESALAKYYYCFALAAANRLDDALKIWSEMKNSNDYVKPMFLGLASVAVGKIDEAFVYLNQAAEEFDPWLVWLATEPKLRPIHSDKRYLELLKRTKNPMLNHFEQKFNEKKSIAVLPLKIIGEAPTGENFLSIGLADAMITKLSQIRRIIVRPTSSILKFADYEDAFLVGKELEVDNVLCGTIRQSGERIRISAQLLDVQTNEAIWSESFDENFDDILDLEDVVAEKVATLLIPKLSGEEKENLAKRNVSNVEAYEAYLRGRYHLFSFTPDNFVKAISYFEKAIEIDPNYALAYVALSDVHFTLTGFASQSPNVGFPLIEKFAYKALRLDNRLGEAYSNLGMVRWYSLDPVRGEKLLKRGLELSPNQLNGYIWYSVFLSSQGKSEEAIALARKAYELDPISGFHQYHYIWVLYHNRRFDEAFEAINKANQALPDFAHGYAVSGWFFRHLNQKEEALEHSERAYQISPATNWISANLAATYAKFGEKEKALELLKKVEADKEQYVSPYCHAQIYLNLGDKEKTLELLEKSVADRDVWFPWIASDPELDSLRDEPRFNQLVQRIRAYSQPEFTNTKSEKTIAVLPFQSIGEFETGEQFLSVGLADAMITRLSQLKRFIVRPTNSILRFAEYEDAFAAGSELDVDFVLGGTIRPAGKQIRISAQLFDIRSNKTLWSEKFDEEFTDILELEDAVSEKVATALLPQLSEDEKADFGKRATDNNKAFEAYLRGRYHWNRFTEEDLQKSIVAYQEALQHDPKFALAYAGIADFYNFLTIFGSKSPRQSFPAAKQAAKKAIELDPNLAEAYIALGVVALGYDWDFREAERLLMKGLYLNPNYAVGHYWYAQLLSLNGEHENAINEMQIAEKLSPGIPSLIVYHGFTLRNARKFDESLEKLREALAIQPNYYVGIQAFCWTVKWTKNYEEAEELNRKAVEQTNRLSLLLYSYAYILATRDKTEEARKIAEELEKRYSESYIPAIYLVLIYTELGEFDLAFQWLEKSFTNREFWAIWLPIDPRFDALKSDKRYAEFCRRIKPIAEIEDPIHQSRIPTKRFPPFETKIENQNAAEVKEKIAVAKANFFQKHKYKFAFAGVLTALILIGMATGVITFDFNDRRVGIQTKNDASANSDISELPDSIVILPFKAEDSQIGDIGIGLADSLTVKLGAVKRLSVLSANSGRSVVNDDAQNIGRELGVQYVLRSQIVKADAIYKINSELLKTSDGKSVWTAEIETKAEDLFTVLNKLGAKILESLKIEPLPVEKQQFEKIYTTNGFAYELFLVGRSQMANRSPENIRKAITTYTKSVEADPNFALAYVGLADAYNLRNLYEIPSPPDTYPKAIENAKKALAIDPELPLARVSLAYASFFHLRDRATAELEYRRAIQLNPSYAQAHNWFSAYLAATNRLPEAISEAKTAIRLDPRSLSAKSGAGLTYFYDKQFDQAVSEANNALAIDTNFLPSIRLLRWVYQSQGNYQRAKEIYQRERLISSEGTDAEWYMIEAQVEALGDKKAEVLQKLNASVEETDVKNNPNAYAYEIALAYHALGDENKAFEWLEKAESAGSYGFNFLEADHRFEGLKNDSRYQKLLEKLKTPRKQ